MVLLEENGRSRRTRRPAARRVPVTRDPRSVSVTGPGQPPPSGSSGFGRVIEAETIRPGGGQLNAFAGACQVAVVVPAGTFSKPIELVLSEVEGQNRGFAFDGFRFFTPQFLCGLGVTVYGGGGPVSALHLPKLLDVSFPQSRHRRGHEDLRRDPRPRPSSPRRFPATARASRSRATPPWRSSTTAHHDRPFRIATDPQCPPLVW